MYHQLKKIWGRYGPRKYAFLGGGLLVFCVWLGTPAPVHPPGEYRVLLPGSMLQPEHAAQTLPPMQHVPPKNRIAPDPPADRPVSPLPPAQSLPSTTALPNLENTDLWTPITVRRGDNLGKIFRRLGLTPQKLARVVEVGGATHVIHKLKPGQTLHFWIQDQDLVALATPIDPAKTLYIVREEVGHGFRSVIQERTLGSRIAFGRATIERSLLDDGRKAGLDPALIRQLTEIFGHNVNFAVDLQPKDRVRLLFQEEYADGQRIRTGHILAAELVNGNQVYRAFRFEDRGEVGYYDPNGHNLQKTFMRTPVQFTRISSHFNLRRKHPILHRIRAHRGVDYAAPAGTPVYAAADGVAKSVGTQSGYGRTVVLQHGARYSTLYGHLSRFAPTLRAGARVKQGQLIGYVGMSGLATAPHLHYEFRVNGVHQDPLKVTTLPNKERLAPAKRARFHAEAGALLALLDHHELHHG